MSFCNTSENKKSIEEFEKFFYEGLICTSIKVEVHPDDPTLRTFSEADNNAKDGAGVFLKNVKLREGSSTKSNEREFVATHVDKDNAKLLVESRCAKGDGKPLFCVHGFNVEPYDALVESKQAYEDFDDDKIFYLIPVLWASGGGLTQYDDDKWVRSVNAGNALRKLFDGMDETFPSKSILAHSMGNFVLYNGAIEPINAHFDNIFHVAADISYDIYHKNVNSDKKARARNIFNMLSLGDDNKPKGKIYNLINGGDLALTASSWLPTWTPIVGGSGETRIGQVGAGVVKKRRWFSLGVAYNWVQESSILESDYSGYIETFDVGELVDWKKLGDSNKHSYQFDVVAIDFYESKHV